MESMRPLELRGWCVHVSMCAVRTSVAIHGNFCPPVMELMPRRPLGVKASMPVARLSKNILVMTVVPGTPLCCR